MDKLINLYILNNTKSTYLAEELNIPNIFNIIKINDKVPPEIVDSINQYIKTVQPTIMIGINKFKLTALLSKITANDISYADFLKMQTTSTNIFTTYTNLPKTFILANMLLPIRNQVETNCCIAFSTSCAIEYKNIMTQKYLDYLSPAFIYNNRIDATVDIGMNSKDAINIVQQFGTSTDKICPMSYLNQSIQPYMYENAINYKINESYYITSLNDLKLALYNNGPVIAILPVYPTQTNNNTFWIKPSNFNNSDSIIDINIGYHCVSIVGYDDISSQLLLRNSWGTNWGIDGYYWFSYSDFNIIVESWTLTPNVPQPNSSVYLSTTLNNKKLNMDNTSDNTNQIFGLDQIVFYSLLAGIILFIIIIIIVIILRYRQNRKIITKLN